LQQTQSRLPPSAHHYIRLDEIGKAFLSIFLPSKAQICIKFMTNTQQIHVSDVKLTFHAITLYI